MELINKKAWRRINISFKGDKIIVLYKIKQTWTLGFELPIVEDLAKLTGELVSIMKMKPMSASEERRFLGLFYEDIIIEHSSFTNNLTKATVFEDVAMKIDIWLGKVPYQIKTTSLSGKGHDEVIVANKRDKVKLLFINIADREIIIGSNTGNVYNIEFNKIKIF